MVVVGDINLFDESHDFVTRPIDDEMDRSWVHGQPNLAVFPFPIMEETSDSIIGNARFEEFDVPRHLKLKRIVHYRVERWRRDAPDGFEFTLKAFQAVLQAQGVELDWPKV